MEDAATRIFAHAPKTGVRPVEARRPAAAE